MSTNHDTTKDVKQADNSKLENVFHTKRKIVKYTHDGEWVDYCPSPITKPSNRNIASKSAQEQERFSCELCEFKCNSERTLFSHMSTNHAKIEQLDGIVSQIDSVNVSLGVLNHSDFNPEIVEKPTALAPESYAEKVKVKVPVPIKDEHICDLCDFSFKNRADLKMHYLNKHYLTSSATKEQKSSKKKRNKKNPGRNSTFSLMMKMRKQMKCGKPLCIFLNVSIPFKIETFWGKCHNLIFMSPSNSSIKCSSYRNEWQLVKRRNLILVIFLSAISVI